MARSRGREVEGSNNLLGRFEPRSIKSPAVESERDQQPNNEFLRGTPLIRIPHNPVLVLYEVPRYRSQVTKSTIHPAVTSRYPTPGTVHTAKAIFCLLYARTTAFACSPSPAELFPLRLRQSVGYLVQDVTSINLKSQQTFRSHCVPEYRRRLTTCIPQSGPDSKISVHRPMCSDQA